MVTATRAFVPTGIAVPPTAAMPTVRPSMAAAIAVPTAATVTAVTATAGMPVAVTLSGGWFGDRCQAKAECQRSQASN